MGDDRSGVARDSEAQKPSPERVKSLFPSTGELPVVRSEMSREVGGTLEPPATVPIIDTAHADALGEAPPMPLVNHVGADTPGVTDPTLRQRPRLIRALTVAGIVAIAGATAFGIALTSARTPTSAPAPEVGEPTSSTTPIQTPSPMSSPTPAAIDAFSAAATTISCSSTGATADVVLTWDASNATSVALATAAEAVDALDDGEHVSVAASQASYVVTFDCQFQERVYTLTASGAGTGTDHVSESVTVTRELPVAAPAPPAPAPEVSASPEPSVSPTPAPTTSVPPATPEPSPSPSATPVTDLQTPDATPVPSPTDETAGSQSP